MNDPKTADQINSQVLGKADSLDQINAGYSLYARLQRDQMKRNIALRLLVEKWRNNAGTVSYLEEPESVFRQCAKELEEALSGL